MSGYMRSKHAVNSALPWYFGTICSNDLYLFHTTHTPFKLSNYYYMSVFESVSFTSLPHFLLRH